MKLIIAVVIVAVSLANATRQGGRNVKKGAKKFLDPDTCFNYPDEIYFTHDDCDRFWVCEEDGELWEGECPPETPIFDHEFFFCGVEGEAICWMDADNYPDYPQYPEYPDYGDSECPLDTTEVVFLPADHCDEYYICLNGVPNLFQCREGQHWNEAANYCDEPHLAGCDETAESPTTLPDCRLGLVGTLPHPTNCNWFIYCDNGNRSIQQCQHLFHYDIVQDRCLFLTAATCIKDT